MMKYICSEAKPKTRFLRVLFHANPDRLVDLTHAATKASPEEATAIRRKFTEILDDIYVDGVWKKTSWGRLPETERAIVNFLASDLPVKDTQKPLRILDVGASDGSTSVNLLSAVRDAYEGPVEMTVADLNVELRRFRKGRVTEYRTTRGAPVMVAFGRIGIRLPQSEHAWFWLSDQIARWYLRQDDLRTSLREDGAVPLVNPIAACEPAIDVIELNCLTFEPALTERFDVIRASNLISPRYGFKGERLQNCLSNLHAYLKPDGALLISRNEGDTDSESGSIWRRTLDGFALVNKFCGGSEIEASVNAFVAATPISPLRRQG